ncbi:hypothetical protein JCM6882_004252 [Rhodosporidiobolus microsporus]
MSWNAVLENYARMKRPQKEIPPGVWLADSERTLTIFDGYEKAKYHFLVMPRDPFPLEGGGTVPSSHLESLTKLLKSEHKVEVLKALQTQAEEVKEMIQDEMQKEEGWEWDVQVGFHAVESMKHVHLHVISSDLISPKLKNKKHYNSFHPKLGFFLHLDEVLEEVESGTFSLQPPKTYEALLKDDLVSHYTGDVYANIPKLKAHLEDEWKTLGRRRRKEIEVRRKREEERAGVKDGGNEGPGQKTSEGGQEAKGHEEDARKGKRQKTEG